jgi:hypothetical protein
MHLKGIWCEVLEYNFLAHIGYKEQALVKMKMNFGFNKIRDLLN